MEETILDTLENDSIIPEDVQEKLSRLLERYQLLSDEDKEQFQKGAVDVLSKTLRKLSGNSILSTWLAPYESYILFIFAVSFVAIPLVMGVRQLYRRTREREQSQTEKKKLKKQKIKVKQQKANIKKKQQKLR
ncbi:uncharacterized protein [Polyergus mexicanus]|uniref:uncharacterized protein n=1 Tax=Polyergus mexicanus TaxID=615972 RepID=UPI0038B4C1BB